MDLAYLLSIAGGDLVGPWFIVWTLSNVQQHAARLGDATQATKPDR
jgi:hypothetical protein